MKYGGRSTVHTTNSQISSGGPAFVKIQYICSNNPLTSLEGAPDNVLDDFMCSNTDITSFKRSVQKKLELCMLTIAEI